MRFRSASGAEKRLRRRLATLLFGVGLAVAGAPSAQAQYVWNGANSDYNLPANWSPSAGAPPIAGGQSAIFGASGSNNISVTAGPITPDSWTFNANSKAFSISGADVTFAAGLVNNASAGTISIANVIDGAGINVVQLGAGTLQLSGANTYSGLTFISAGTIRVTDASALGTSTVRMDGGTFQTVGSLTVANDFNVTAAGGTIDVNASVLTLSGVLSDVAAVPVLNVISSGGAGTLVLTGTNTIAGTLNVTGVTVVAGNASAVGNATVGLSNATFQTGAADLIFNNDFVLKAGGGTIDANGFVTAAPPNGFSVAIAGNISGAGELRIKDSTNTFGTVVLLSGALNTYTGGTVVTDTTLRVTNNNSVGTGTVTLDNAMFQPDGFGGNLTFNNNFKVNETSVGSALDANNVTLTIAGDISDGVGKGQLTMRDSAGAGNGIVVLLGTNTYSGGTIICDCATLQLGDATHKASIVGDVFNEGSFVIVNADTSKIKTITNEKSGFGLGLTTFMGDNTAANITITNRFNGATLFAENSTAGNAMITNTFSGTTAFGQAGGNETSTAGNATIHNDQGGTTKFFANTSAGSATIVNGFGGGTIFGSIGGPDTPTAANATIINNDFGFTEFGAFSTAGSAKIVTNDGAATSFFDNSTGGKAQFITNGNGYVDFSQSIGPNFDGRITAGSIAGSGTYYIGGITLVVGGNNLSSEVTGVIADGCGCAGAGSLEKVGTGNLILSGVNTYTGSTTVVEGKLTVNGSIVASSDVTVKSGATLGGSGVVSSTTIEGGGTLAPGNPVGTLTVTGSLVFATAASYYAVQISGATAGRTDVSLGATLGGATVTTNFGPGTYVPRQYVILHAGNVPDTFNPVVATNAPNFKTSLTYDANNVYLNLTALSFGPGLNQNQQNVANALTNAFNNGVGVPGGAGFLTPAGLTQISGELATGSQQATFDAMNMFLGLLTDPFIAGRNGGAGGGAATPYTEESGSLAYAAKQQNARDAFARFPTKADVARNDPFEQRWNVWGAAFGGGSNTDGNAVLGSNNATARAYGVAVGADYRISPATSVGFALAGGGTNFSVIGSGSGRSDLFQAGAFVRHSIGAAYITAAAAYGWQDVTTDRTLTVAGVDRLRAEFNANAWSGRAEGGYRFATPWLGITPYAAGQFTTYQLPAYAEQVLFGSNAFALSYAAKDVTAGRSELGVRLDRSYAMQDAILTLRGRVAWAHNFNTDRSITPLFQTMPGSTFLVSGAAQAPDTALTTASAEMKWMNGWSAATTFEGEFSDITRAYAGKGVVRYAW